MRILLILFIVILLYFLQGNLYSKYAFKKISVDIKFKQNNMFEGEDNEVVFTILNKKLLPIWWASINFSTSKYLIFEKKININLINDNTYISDQVFLMPYEGNKKHYGITALKRGYYSIDNIELLTRDLFGIYEILGKFEVYTSLYVYPKLLDPDDAQFNFKRFNGDVLSKRHVIEDPFLLRGIRDYEPFDSFKSINWKASAKTNELKTNQFDFSSSQEIIFFLNIEKNNAWDSDKIVEKSISIVASLATKYIKDGMQISILTNGFDILTGDLVKLLSEVGDNKTIRVLEALSTLDSSKASGPISEVMADEALKRNTNPMWILVSHTYKEELQDQFYLSKALGYDIKWIIPIDQDINDATIDETEDIFMWQ